MEVRSPYLDLSLVKFVWRSSDNFLLKKILISLFYDIVVKNSQVKFTEKQGLNHR